MGRGLVPHDGSAPESAKAGYGSNWLIVAVLVRAAGGQPSGGFTGAGQAGDQDTISASRLWLGRRMAQMLAGALAGRDTHVVDDAAYAGKELKGVPPGITWTTRLRNDAARYELPRLVPGGGDGPAQKAVAYAGRARR